ncbi:MAG: hypothetical protein J5824_10455 [Lachnospiraceae bacterium]|nr:hypothetical protein [Lachnospiraceae bacterium]
MEIKLRYLIVLLMLIIGIGFISAPENASAGAAFGYAFGYTEKDILDLSFEEMIAASADCPITIRGTVSTSKYVLIENGTPRITNKPVYSAGNPTIYIALPAVTISKNYAMDDPVNDFVRLKDSPITGWLLHTEYAITAGTYTDLTLELFVGNEGASAVVSNADIQIQVFDGTAWRDIVVADGSHYEITETIKEESDPDISKCRGITASIEDCSINGFAYKKISDARGLELNVEGAVFRYGSNRKYHIVTNWFSNLPVNCTAMVAENPESDTSTHSRIVLADYKFARVVYSTPLSAGTEPIEVVIPLEDLLAEDGTQPWAGINGGVVVPVNQNAIFNIYDINDFAEQNKPLIISTTVAGWLSSFRASEEDYYSLATGQRTIITYIPQEMYLQLPEEDGKKVVKLRLEPETNILRYNGEEKIDLIGTELSVVSEGVYSVSALLDYSKLTVKNEAEGEFTVKIMTQSGFITVARKQTHVKYSFQKPESAHDDNEENEGGENGGNGGGSENGESGGNGENGGESSDPGHKPDIWVNGKDNKREETYHKTMTKELSSLISSLPEGCKYIVSVTETTIDDVANAFASGGKAKKSDIAKPSVKAKDGIVSVAAGKTAGVARIWVAAYNSKAKKIEASGYFDVTVGTAPKKLYLTADSKAEKTSAIKSIMLNMGDTETVFVNADGTGLSSYASFTWEAPKDTDGLLSITPSNGTAQSATIGLNSVPTDGKVKKISVNAINNESGKKVSFSVIISNAVKEVTGLSKTYQLDSAAEAAVEATLDYSLVCYSSTGTTTDKIKVYVTTTLEEGTGYTLTKNNTKFTQSGSKSKVKVTYKDGAFTLKAPKKTTDGTKVRVLIVATHADKTIDVFESGVITIGTAAAEDGN